MGGRQRSGFSLIEVIGGIALLSATLVGLVSAWNAHRAQIELAEQKILAAEWLEQKLPQWYFEGKGPPCPQYGRLPGGDLIWRTSFGESRQQFPTQLAPVRVELSNGRGDTVVLLEVVRWMPPRRSSGRTALPSVEGD